MDPERFIGRILDDEGIAGNLDEPLATPLIEWLVARAADAIANAATEDEAEAKVAELAGVGRHIGKIVAAWESDGPQAASREAKNRGWPPLPEKLEKAADVLNWLQTTAP